MDHHKLCLQNHGMTHVKVTECTYDWTITNFRYFLGNAGRKIQSPIFTAGPTNKLKWQLYLYPWGYSEDYEEYVSIHLVRLDYCSDQLGCFIDVIRNDGKLSGIQEKRKLNPVHLNETDCILPNFVKRNRLIDEASDLLLNETTLKLRCRLFFSNGYVNDPLQPTTTLLPVEPETPIDFEQFLSGKFSDVKLVLNGGKEFPVHRIMLSARSRVFAAMFEHDMKEQKENRVEITDVDAEVMREVLRFVYTGKVNDDNIKAIASDLFVAADKYAIDGLKNMCENSLIQGLSLINVGDVLEIADRHGAETLKKAALDFVAVYVKELADSEKFRTSMKSVSHLLGEMMSALTLKYK